MGAACSATAGVVALLLDRWVRRGESVGTSTPVAAAPVAGRARRRPDRGARRRGESPRDRRRLALTLAFVSGLTSLGYQVVWNRLIGAGTGSSTYVFTIILVLFLVGIATGAILLGLIRPRVRSVVGLIAIAQLLTAAFVTVGAVVLASPVRLVHQRHVGEVRRLAA